MTSNTSTPVPEGDEGGEDLNLSRREFRAIIDRINDAFYALDCDWRFTYINHTAKRFWEREDEELVGNNIWETFPEAVGSFPYDQHIRAFEQQRTLHFETISPVLDRWVEVFIYPNESGLSVYFRDIDEKKRVKDALAESERKFRQLAEQSILGIALIQEGTFKYLNSRAAELFGYEVQELAGQKGPRDVVHPADWPRVRAHLERRLAGKEEAVTYQMRGVRKDGQVIHVEIHGTRILSEGQPALLSYVLDVTGRRKLQQDILHVQEEERRRIGQDLHDGVASQLTGLSMIIDSLIEDAQQEGTSIADQLERVKSLIKESGEDVRRISRGLHPVHLQESGLPGTLERLAERFGTRDNISCSCSLAWNGPTIPDDVATHLYWIAQEAVTNARKYAEAEVIQITLKRDDGELLLAVADDGRGFAPGKNQPDGLGLRTMRYRAELIGGTLTIHSAPGEGTTVQCHLPITVLGSR